MLTAAQQSARDFDAAHGMTTNYIYYLVDPRTDEIRYVGKTDQDIEKRITAHMRDSGSCHRVNWLNELKAEGMRPFGVIISSTSGEWPWQENERYWISRLKAMGARLTNNTSGGDGVSDLPAETRGRMRRTWLGRKHTPETISKLKIARARRVTTDETRAKMSASQTGRKITWGAALSEANRKLTKEQAVEIKRRLDCGEKVQHIAAEFGMHRTSISKIKIGTYFDRYRSVQPSVACRNLDNATAQKELFTTATA